jgi:hypothetical protein
MSGNGGELAMGVGLRFLALRDVQKGLYHEGPSDPCHVAAHYAI